MTLSSSDYKAILELIEIAHSIPDRNAMLQAVWEKFERLVPFSGAIHLPFDPVTRSFSLQGHVSRYCPSKLLFLFVVYYAPPCPARSSRVPMNNLNQAFRLTDIISPAELSDTEYGRDFLPLHPYFYEMGAVLGSQGDLIGTLGFHRRRENGDFTDRHKEILGLIAPHLSRAIHNQQLLETISRSCDIGIIRSIGKGQPLYLSEEAKRALGDKPIETIPDPGLSNAPVFFKSDTGVYRVRSAKGMGTERLLLLEPVPNDRDPKSTLAGLGLTRRQEEVALWVIRGYSNRMIAKKLFISEQTVKDHLQDVFEHIKVKSRAALIAKVLGTKEALSDGLAG